MNETLVNIISPEALRLSLSAFWNEQLTIESNAQGLTAALPLMYPDGWQVVIHIEPFSEGKALITDKGRTLSMLDREGLNLDARARHNYALLEEKKKIFELDQKGFELCRLVALPFNGLDIQLFGESLVSIAHLLYRCESKEVRGNTVGQSLRQSFALDGFHPREGVVLEGKVESVIKVDFLFEKDERQLAMKAIEIRDRVRDYMERWAWRWTDLKHHNAELRCAMVYDMDNQEWDDMSLRIGNEVCDLFLPVHERDRIHDALIRLKVA